MSPEYSAPGGSSVSPYRWGDATAKQISGGVITKDSGAHKITPEGGSGDDDLVTINGGTEGDLLILLAASAAGTITLKNGTGNILGPDGKDVPLDQSDERVILQYEGSYWRVQAVSPALFKVLYNPIEDDDISEADGFLRKTGAGAYEAVKCKLDATAAPTANDDSGDGYAVGSRWIDVANDKEYVCLDASVGSAVWTETTGGGDPNYRWGAVTTKQISGGVITKDAGAHEITPEGGSGDDDLVTINGGTEGDLLILLAASAAGTITLKNGTGNILGPDGKDVPLDQSDERVILQYEGSYWRVQAVSPALFKVLYNPIEDDDISEADGFLRKTGAGAYEAIKCKLDATTAPTANDDTGDGYAVGALWIDVTNDKVYQCVDATAAAAVWKHLSARNRFQAVLVGPSSTVTTGTGLGGDWRISSQPITILAVGAYVEEPGTTGFLTIDINENGTTILSTRITIDSGEESSQDAATPAVISDAAGAADAVYTFDVDGVHTTPPEGLKVWIEYV